MERRSFGIILLGLAILSSGFHFFRVSAQAVSPNAVSARQAALQVELDQILKDIASQQKILDEKKREGVSLERDIAILNANIAGAKLKIRAHNIAIEGLGKDIIEKTETIGELNEKIERGRDSLAHIIRKTNEIDSSSLIEVVLDERDVSEFFADLDTFDSIKASLRTLFAEIRESKIQTETAKNVLNKKRLQEIDARISVEAEKRKIESAEAEKKRLLSLSKKEQKNYETVIKDREKKAAEIRSALFALRDTAAIPFGKAFEYATLAESKTGVRPAFLLAILMQESELGENIGTCNRLGDPPEKGWRKVMKPTRDHEPFLRITSELGFNPDAMPVSCPIAGGWGGALGPAQFIPSTWELYKSKVGSALAKNPPNPWEPKDAIMASGLFLKDLGAASGGWSAEKEAALRYYAGANWKKAANQFYGNQVMAKAQNIQ